MQAGQVYDDVEAVIMAAEEHPEYREHIIDGFIDQVLRRRKRRFSMWRTTALLLVLGGLGTAVHRPAHFVSAQSLRPGILMDRDCRGLGRQPNDSGC